MKVWFTPVGIAILSVVILRIADWKEGEPPRAIDGTLKLPVPSPALGVPPGVKHGQNGNLMLFQQVVYAEWEAVSIGDPYFPVPDLTGFWVALYVSQRLFQFVHEGETEAVKLLAIPLVNLGDVLLRLRLQYQFQAHFTDVTRCLTSFQLLPDSGFSL